VVRDPGRSSVGKGPSGFVARSWSLGRGRHDNHRALPCKFRLCAHDGVDAPRLQITDDGRRPGPSGEVDEPPTRPEQPPGQLPGAPCRGQSTGQAGIDHDGGFLRSALDDGHIVQAELGDSEVQERSTLRLRLNEGDLSSGLGDGHGDAREAGPGPCVCQRRVLGKETPHGPERVQNVPLPESIGIGGRQEPSRDRVLLEEFLVPAETVGDATGRCRRQRFVLAFHVKRSGAALPLAPGG
jgi:hypothetical protein